MTEKAREDGYGFCPHCGADSHKMTTRERRLNGNTKCGSCEKTSPSIQWSYTK